VELWIKDYHDKNGEWGFAAKGWLVDSFLGELFRIGRLQFHFEKFPYDFTVFRSKISKKVVMLARDGLSFRPDGQFANADNKESTASWTSSCSRNDDKIIANPVDPRGYVLPERRELSAAEWQQILQKDDPILGIHIPADGSMGHEICGDSFRAAVKFFPTHFPDRPFHAFNCTSWLLDGQFDEQLPEKSNIRRFLREFYLHPVPKANDNQLFERVFGKRFENIDQAPQDSSLQRTIIDLIKAGGTWRDGGAVLFPENLDWGRAVYR